MKFKFIGTDGSMGLKKNSIHTIRTSIANNLLWATWENNSCPYKNLEAFLANWEMVSADVEVKHGHWFFVEYEYFTCSECGDSYYIGSESTAQTKEMLRNGEYHKYCHNCGARMDGEG